ncbi:MAG: ABC transporter permease [Bacteroidaceae bacterium]|nr:ABC transporter permease [Bacteroidaceae bacterium]
MTTNNSIVTKTPSLGGGWVGLHNLKTGWRNILKYKVQNTVSILCLSVGIICFGITLYFCNAMWHNTLKQEFDSKYITGVGIDRDIEGRAPTTIAFADSLKQLPSVKTVLFYQQIINTEFTFRGKNGKETKIQEDISIISPDWLKEHNFYSTITGKKIGTLKHGTIVVSKSVGDALMTNDIEPIGARIINTVYSPISDVVVSDTYMYSFGGICIVVEGAENLHTSDMEDILNTEIYRFEVRLNDDADFEQFVKERKSIRPNTEYWENSYKQPVFALIVFTFLIFLGASVLTIGISGYLKMQLQLFTLRCREMALRRCNGAHPRHIFWLYVSEILIVAALTAIVTAIVAYAFQGFMMPKLDLFSFSNIIYINLKAIYRIIAEVLIATFVLAIAFSWFSLRKVISKPLSETVGRSYAHKSAFTKTMQVAQYFVATIFLFAALAITYGIKNSSKEERLGLKNGVDDFKNIALIDNPAYPFSLNKLLEFDNPYKALPSADKVARYFTEYFRVKQGEYNDERINVEYFSVTDSIDYYQGFYANPEIFSIYGREIVEKKVRTEHPYDAEATPVFAFPEEAKQMAKTLGVTHRISDELVPLPDGRQCILLGYARTLPQEIILKNTDSYYVVASDSVFCKHFEESFISTNHFLIKAKDGKIDQLQEELAAAWDRNLPELAGMYHGITAYDRWCKEYKVYQVIGQLCFLLVAVSILCIILTVYSSVSLETRGRQKEIAIRKVNGAKTKDIIRLFSRHYVRTLAIAFILAFIIGITIIVAISIAAGDWPELEIWLYSIAFYLTSIIIVTIVTTLTVGQKIYKVAKTNAAEYLTD